MVFAEDTTRTGGHGWRRVSPARRRGSSGAEDPLGEPGRGAVAGVCRELGHDWRDRELDPATTVALFVQQVLHGNCPCSEVRHLPSARRAGADFTPRPIARRGRGCRWACTSRC
jgi:hypothetical protein